MSRSPGERNRQDRNHTDLHRNGVKVVGDRERTGHAGRLSFRWGHNGSKHKNCEYSANNFVSRTWLLKL
jgi:hypothetical protein